MYSLTAFYHGDFQTSDGAAGCAHQGKIHYSLQIASVNQRNFELKLQCPEEFLPLEIKIRQFLHEALQRGSIQCRIQKVTAAGQSSSKERGGVPPELPEQIIEQLMQVKAVEQLALSEGIPLRQCSAVEVLSLIRSQLAATNPANTSHSTLAAPEDERLWENLRSALNEGCQKLWQERFLEGQGLKRELERLLFSHQQLLTECHGMEERLAESYQNLLKSKLAKYRELLEQSLPEEDYQQRFYHELAILLSKGDIREELSRLDIHQQKFTEILARESKPPQALGKELEFLSQEMNREANTLASKSPLSDIQQKAIQLKLIIEQIREQLRNVF